MAYGLRRVGPGATTPGGMRSAPQGLVRKGFDYDVHVARRNVA